MPEDRQVLAIELAFGLLEGDELAQAKRLQLSDPDFAALVQVWSRRFGVLASAVPGETPPARLKQRVNDAIDRLDGGMGDTPHFASDTVDSSQPANDNQISTWRRLALAASFVATLLAGYLAFDMFGQTGNEPREIIAQGGDDGIATRQFVAQLTGPEEGQFVLINWREGADTLEVRAIGLEDETLAPELWVIPADGTPRSLGTARGEGSANLALSEALAPFLIDGATIAVTMEDPANAPHQAPTPPIIAVGTLLTI